MGEISRQHEAGITAGAPNDAAQVSAELDNIIESGVNDNYNNGTETYSGGGTPKLSVIGNANRIVTNEADLVLLDGRVTVNEGDIDTNTAAIALNTAFREASTDQRVLTYGTTAGNVNPSVADIQSNEVIYLTADPITANLYLKLPSVTSADEGLHIKIYTRRSGSASYYKHIGGDYVMYQTTANPAPAGTYFRIANQTICHEARAVVLESTTTNVYLWHISVIDNTQILS